MTNRINKYYLGSVIVPLAITLYLMAGLRKEQSLFEKQFQNFTAQKCVVNKVDCDQHGYYDAVMITTGNVVTPCHSYAKPSCSQQKKGREFTAYVSSYNKRIVSFKPPNDVIKEFNFELKLGWIVFPFFSIPMLIVAFLKTNQMKRRSREIH